MKKFKFRNNSGKRVIVYANNYTQAKELAQLELTTKLVFECK